MPQGELVDTHVHLIGDPARYPLHPTALPGDSWYREAPTDAETFVELMGRAGVGRAVLVQPVGAYGFDNGYVLDAARARPERFASVCAIDPAAPDPVGEIQRCVDAGAAGLRFFTVRDPDPLALDFDAYQPLWQEAVRLGCPVVATVMFPQLAGVARALVRHPEARIVIDHCGFPDLSEPPAFAGARPLFDLARHPQIAVKVTNHVLGQVSAATGQAFLAQLVNAFGSARVMWGSDFAQTHDRPYSQLADVGRLSVETLTPPQRADVLGRSAARFWWRP